MFAQSLVDSKKWYLHQTSGLSNLSAEVSWGQLKGLLKYNFFESTTKLLKKQMDYASVFSFSYQVLKVKCLGRKMSNFFFGKKLYVKLIRKKHQINREKIRQIDCQTASKWPLKIGFQSFNFRVGIWDFFYHSLFYFFLHFLTGWTLFSTEIVFYFDFVYFRLFGGFLRF